MVTSPSRGQNILDLFFTPNHTLVFSVIRGLFDHDIVLAQVNVKPEVTKQVSRNIPLYKKVNWDQLINKKSMRDFHLELLQSSLATTDVHSLWDKFVTRLQQCIDKFIPVRKVGTRCGFP